MINECDDNFIKMIQRAFTKELYQEKQYLNPSQSKIRNAFAKKSNKHPKRNNILLHNRNLSYDSNRHSLSPIQNGQANDYQHLKVILHDNSSMLKEIKQALVIENPVSHQLRILKQKNVALEADLKAKDQKLQSLKEKYQQIVLKFQQFSNTSKNNSFNTSFDSNTNRSTFTTRRGDFTGELKAIRQKLKSINFCKIFTMINRFKKSPQKLG